CVVSMDQARSVQATFTRNNVTLTITMTGEGAGTVFVNNAAVCVQEARSPSESCDVNTFAGSTLVISATAGAHSMFEGFDDACSGTGSCSLEITTNRIVTANFSLQTM